MTTDCGAVRNLQGAPTWHQAAADAAAYALNGGTHIETSKP